MVEIKDIRKNPKELIIIQNECLLFEFTVTGEIRRMVAKGIEFKSVLDTKTNQERNRICISVYDLFYHQLDWYDLVGSWSPSRLYCSEDSLQWQGNYKDVDYLVTFRLCNNIWFWTIQLSAKNKLIEISQLQHLNLTGDNTKDCLFEEHYFVKSNEACVTINLGRKSKDDKENVYIQQGIIDDIKVDYCKETKEKYLSESETYWQNKTENLLKHNKVDIYKDLNVIKLQTEDIQVNDKIELAFYGVCSECLNEAEPTFSTMNKVKAVYHSLNPIKLEKEVILDF